MRLAAEGVWFGYGDRWVLRDVDLEVAPGEIVGLGGPSGCGKSTLARLLTGRLRPDRGTIRRPEARGRAVCVQLVGQHPAAAMNPRWRVRAVLAEADPQVDAVVASGLVHPAWLDSFPHELSGGELQRVNLARALLTRPAFLVCDEITASLDPITQVEIWTLLGELVGAGDLGLLAISHDRPLLERVADRVVELPSR